MNYRHIYHAGNFADVFKHHLLICLLQALQHKPTPFCYLDTHAGDGCYDLTTSEAQKTREYLTGIGKLWNLKEIPDIVETYLTIVRQVNPNNTLHFYPGSPYIARLLLREQDSMIACELQDEAVHHLQQMVASQRIVQHRDGYQALKALLPPRQRRGLVFIDPPFEKNTEFAEIVNALQVAYKRWSNGIYAIWYPIKSREAVKRFEQKLAQTGITQILQVELCIYPDDVPIRLNGSGMIVINPPWRLAEQLNSLLPWLWRTLATDGRYRIEWIS